MRHYMDALCSVPGEVCKRGVVSGAKMASHKFFGVAGCLSGTGTLCPVLAGQTCVSQNRQHNSGVVCKKSRGYSLSSPVASDTDTADVGQRTFSITQGVHILGYLNGGADLLSRGDRR